MKNYLKNPKPVILIAAMMFLTLMVAANTNQEDNPGIEITDSAFMECDVYGTVYEYGWLDGCEFIIQVDNGGPKLEPVEIIPDIELKDSMRIKFSYEELDVATICMVGQAVAITCIEEISPPDCWVRMKYYPLEGKIADEYPGNGRLFDFVAYGPDNVIDWSWWVNGEFMSSDSIFRYQFGHHEQYEVCVSIITSDSCDAEYCEVFQFDTIGDCIAEFEYYPVVITSDSSEKNISVLPAYTYQFMDQSSGNPVQWKWFINAELFSTEQNPILTFNEEGEYEICLKIVTKSGCESKYCEIVVVGNTEECQAMFEYYPTDIIYAGIKYDSNYGIFTYQFLDQSLGNITYWHWNFGDGTSSLEQNPVHSFPEPGIYKVCLSISSELDACNDKYCMEVIVEKPQHCEAYFEYCEYNYSDKSIEYDTTVWNDTLIHNNGYLIGFKNMSVPDDAYYYWSFGDGYGSHHKNPVHQYALPGFYRVCLTVETDNGCYDKYCKEIKVGIEDCEVDFTYEVIFPDCEGFNPAYVFKPIAEGNIASYYWNFDDGEESWEKKPIHIFEDFGVKYNVCLEVQYSNQCSAKQCHPIIMELDSLKELYYKYCGALAVTNSQLPASIEVSGIYPMPVKDVLTLEVKSNKTQNIRVEFFDLVGKLYRLPGDYQLIEGLNRLDINLNGLKSGTYIYTITTPKKILRGNIVIMQ